MAQYEPASDDVGAIAGNCEGTERLQGSCGEEDHDSISTGQGSIWSGKHLSEVGGSSVHIFSEMSLACYSWMLSATRSHLQCHRCILS